MNTTFVLFETDAAWLKDPSEFFKNQTLVDDADIIVPRKGFISDKSTKSAICLSQHINSVKFYYSIAKNC